MSAPTTLAPWYVVFKQYEMNKSDLLWYQSEYSEAKDAEGLVLTFALEKGGALLFQNLQSAARVAKSQGGMIRVLVTEEEAKEFNRA